MSYVLLVVDDSPIMRSMLKKALTMSGLNVGTFYEAENGREALEKLHNEWIDVVLADIHMPEMTGAELVAEMHKDEVLSSIPVVVVSSDRSPKLRAELREHGIKGYVPKPFRPEDLRDAVCSVLDELGGGQEAWQ